jgi:hypothetical protein
MTLLDFIAVAERLFQASHDFFSVNGILTDVAIIEQIVERKDPIAPVTNDVEKLGIRMRNHDRCEVREIARNNSLDLPSRE